MLELLSQNAEIQEFLGNFHKSQWRKCVEATMFYGLRALKRELAGIPSFEELLQLTGLAAGHAAAHNTLEGLKQDLREMTLAVQDLSCQRSQLAHQKPSKRHVSPATFKKTHRPPLSDRQHLKSQARDTAEKGSSGPGHILQLDAYTALPHNSEESALQIAAEFLKDPFTAGLAYTHSRTLI